MSSPSYFIIFLCSPRSSHNHTNILLYLHHRKQNLPYSPRSSSRYISLLQQNYHRLACICYFHSSSILPWIHPNLAWIHPSLPRLLTTRSPMTFYCQNQCSFLSHLTECIRSIGLNWSFPLEVLSSLHFQEDFSSHSSSVSSDLSTLEGFAPQPEISHSIYTHSPGDSIGSLAWKYCLYAPTPTSFLNTELIFPTTYSTLCMSKWDTCVSTQPWSSFTVPSKWLFHFHWLLKPSPWSRLLSATLTFNPSPNSVNICFFFFFKRFYLFIFRGRNRGRETSMCGCLSCAPHWGPGPQPRHVPWLGIEPVTLWFAG